MNASSRHDHEQRVQRVLDGHVLPRGEACQLFEGLLREGVSEVQLAAVLAALRVRTERCSELVGAVDCLRARMEHPINAPPGAIDIVGTGGDKLGTHNISTASALVVASCGVPVAKHGNRAVSSKCGSADVLQALGVAIDAPFEQIEQSLQEINFGFMLAPRHHPSMRFAASVRAQLQMRTIFNLLGPLVNPAGVERGLYGVVSTSFASLYADAMVELGFARAWIVCGAGGADELTLAGESQALIVEGGTGARKKRALLPEDAGLSEHAMALIIGGSPQENARAILDLLEGRRSKDAARRAFRETVVFNAAAALIVAEKVRTLIEGAKLAQEALHSGAARETLEQLRKIARPAKP